MRRLYFLSLVLLVACLAFRCEKENFESVNIRIKNKSNFHFDSVRVNSPGGNFLYSDIAQNQNSDYKNYQFSYQYAAIRVYLNGQESGIQPIDYVGEKTIEGGNYTYEISIENYPSTNNQPFTVLYNLKRD